MTDADRVLNFWFGNPANPESGYGQPRQVWFQKNPEFDAQIRSQFLADYERAAAGELSTWRQQPRPCLALVILLDQFSRNLFRGQPRSFATDAQALATAEYAIAAGYPEALIPVERFFLYIPFEHSEVLAHQNRCVSLFEGLVKEAPYLQDGLDYARRHRAVIEQFGRFPHRNEILGRQSTPAEAEFLKQPGSRF
ncbi:MAG: DUF924 domain-containing protein [Leptolyngbya sp. SIO4C1]|nr:DUF924 domain-containing protein [Leptolyngbya sp. SIO4C1]